MPSKRTRILATAEQEFLIKGFEGTSIDSIVREVGGSKSTVYAHFADKRVLFSEALKSAGREMDFELSKATVAARSAGSLDEALVLCAVELQSVLYQERALHLMRLLTTEASRFPEVARQFIDQGPERSVAVIEQLLCDHGWPYPGNNRSDRTACHNAARALFDSLTGLSYLRVLLSLENPPDEVEMVRRAEAAVTLVFTPVP